MSESKIVLAIRQYQRDYAWDKSLMAPDGTPVNTRKIAADTHSATYLEDFVASQSKAAGTK